MRWEIDGMTCDGCVRSLTRAVERALPGAGARVSLAERSLTVDLGDPALAEAAVAKAGFAVVRRID